MQDKRQREQAERTRDKIYELCPSGATFNELLKGTGLSKRRLSIWLHRLIEEDVIEKRPPDVMRKWEIYVEKEPNSQLLQMFVKTFPFNLHPEKRKFRKGIKKTHLLQDYAKLRRLEDHERYFVKFKVVHGK